MSTTTDGKEVYTSGGSSKPSTSATATIPPSAPTPPPRIIEEEDDLDTPVSVGTECQRNGCKQKFVSEEESRRGDGEGATCTYHPAPPIFREGSKGYLCCKRRVLEFDEFLKIQGCKTGRHLFVKKAKTQPESSSEELVSCRLDHYQTVSEVRVSVFAKKVDKARSTVRFEETQVHLDLYLPESKRVLRSLSLFDPIDPTASSFSVLGTKVELILVKKDNRSWTLLEQTEQDLGNVNFTFGVGGRTGTMGAKEPVLDQSNQQVVA